MARKPEPTEPSIDEQGAMELEMEGSLKSNSTRMKTKGNAKLPGGKIPGIISTSGSCRIMSDAEIDGLLCGGRLRHFGSIISHGDVQVSGSIKGDGAITVEGSIDVQGFIKTDGDIRTTGSISVAGSITVDGEIHGAGGVNVKGNAKIDGNINSNKELEIRGFAKIDGMVSAKKVLLRNPKLVSSFRRIMRGAGRSKIDGSIRGSELVDIENIHVDGNVSGRVVKIGHNSIIKGTIKYIDDISVAPKVKLTNEPMKIQLNSLEVQEESPNRKQGMTSPLSGQSRLSFCPRCGEKIGKTVKICPTCGSEY